MHLTLPFPPSVNCLFGGGSKQKRFPSAKYKAWLASCPSLESAQYDKIRITIIYHFPDDKARDLDNHSKAILDYLVKQNVIVDDSWQHLSQLNLVSSGIDRKNPRVEILIELESVYC